jgi:hypothetical protein
MPKVAHAQTPGTPYALARTQIEENRSEKECRMQRQTVCAVRNHELIWQAHHVDHAQSDPKRIKNAIQSMPQIVENKLHAIDECEEIVTEQLYAGRRQRSASERSLANAFDDRKVVSQRK